MWTNNIKDASLKSGEDKHSAIASSHLALHCTPSEFPTKKYGELTATATVHVARRKKGQILDLMSRGERSGNTTGSKSIYCNSYQCQILSRSHSGTSPKKTRYSLHKAWPN